MYVFGKHFPTSCDIVPPAWVVFVVLTSFMTACGDESAPPKQITAPPQRITVDSGTFEVTERIAFNGCNSTKTFEGTYDIQIDESAFSMGNWSGDWSANTLNARGQSAQAQTTIRGCTITTWTEVDITFTSGDEFYGHITYRYRVAGSCACCKACQSTWTITGVRVSA